MRPNTVACLALLLLGTALAGCLQPAGPGPAPSGAPTGPLMDLEVPIHVVTVGFDPAFLDTETLRAHLPVEREAVMEGRAGTTGESRPEPFRYKLNWMFHPAPAAFGEALAEEALALSEEAPPSAWLLRYDQGSQQRLCSPCVPTPAPPFAGNVVDVARSLPAKPIRLIDAAGLEAWIEANRGDHGLRFGRGYTFFLLDTYTRGLLPTDTYHYYHFEDGVNSPQTDTQRSSQNMRAWGGTHDFVWLDVGAAPNGWDYRPWAQFFVNGTATMTDKVDPPIWDLLDDKARFHENLGRNLRDFAIIKVARNPLYHFDYQPSFRFPIYLIVDPNARTNPQSPLARVAPGVDPATGLDMLRLEQAFAELTPHVRVSMELKVLNLPGDDPGLAEAVAQAKQRGGPGFVDFGYIKSYLREHWEEYVPPVPETRSYPQFVFWLEYPSAGCCFAYSDADEWGESWGVFTNLADIAGCRTQAGPVVTFRPCPLEEAWERGFTAILTSLASHEWGHSVALTHAHDSGDVDERGYLSYTINWLWDSTLSAMTYRHEYPGYDRFDRDFMVRGHAGWLLNETRVGLWRAGQAGSAEGGHLAQARQAYDEAIGLLQQERLAEAFQSALASRDHVREALRPLALPVPAEVTKVTQNLEIPASATGVWPFASVPGVTGAPNPLLIASFLAGERAQVEGVTKASFALPVPEGTTRIDLAWRELDGGHLARQAFLLMTNGEGDPVGALFNAGADKAVILDHWRCGGECTVTIYALSGARAQFEVTADVVGPGGSSVRGGA